MTAREDYLKLMADDPIFITQYGQLQLTVNLVRRLLRKWKYPPDVAEEAIKLVLEQA